MMKKMIIMLFTAHYCKLIHLVFYCPIPFQRYSSKSLHNSLICDKRAKINLASDLCPQCLHILVSYCPNRRVKQITEVFHPVITLGTKVCRSRSESVLI